MTQVITAIPSGDTAFYARSLETGEQAIVITQLVRRIHADTKLRCGAPTTRNATGSTCINPNPDGGNRCWMHTGVR